MQIPQQLQLEDLAAVIVPGAWLVLGTITAASLAGQVELDQLVLQVERLSVAAVVVLLLVVSVSGVLASVAGDGLALAYAKAKRSIREFDWSRHRWLRAAMIRMWNWLYSRHAAKRFFKRVAPSLVRRSNLYVMRHVYSFRGYQEKQDLFDILSVDNGTNLDVPAGEVALFWACKYLGDHMGLHPKWLWREKSMMAGLAHSAEGAQYLYRKYAISRASYAMVGACAFIALLSTVWMFLSPSVSLLAFLVLVVLAAFACRSAGAAARRATPGLWAVFAMQVARRSGWSSPTV